MKLLRYNQPGFDRALDRALAASSLADPVIERRVAAIIAGVRARGDRALLEYAAKFDGVKLTAKQLVAPPPTTPITPGLRRALQAAQRNVAAFAWQSLRRDWEMRNAEGGRVGEKFDPIQRVGIYIPGGTAPLVSSAVMTVALAKVAGCPEIVVCSPSMDPSLQFAVRAAGATEVYRVGGAQAIAALALGTKTIRRVNKIYGPGNAYVTAAKRLLFGVVGIDMLAGPSELLVLADDSANPAHVAADLLAQAEHGSGHERVWLVTTSRRLLEAVPRAACVQMEELRRHELIIRAIKNGCVFVLAKDLPQAIAITNRFAPEHLEIMTGNPRAVAKRITTAGAIFLGPWTPTVVGDYLAGPSHALPTGGAGAYCAGLTVDQFQRRTSVTELSRQALAKSLPALEAFGEVEGLDAHVASARIRSA